MIYVSHDVLPNPFDELPTCWNAEVVAAVPEPSAFLFSGVCVVLGLVLKLKRQESD